MTNVLAMFTDSSVTQVIIEKLQTDYSTELSLEFYGDTANSKVWVSGEKAIRSAFRVLKDRGMVNSGNYAFSYEFSEISPIAGPSASLAFALKFIDKFEKINFDLAATGVIRDTRSNARIEAVDSINEKISGAVQKLETGSMIFYPGLNDIDITDDVLKQADIKDVKLCPVNMVEEAVKALLDENARRSGVLHAAEKTSFQQDTNNPLPDSKPGKTSGKSGNLLTGLLLILLTVLCLSYWANTDILFFARFLKKQDTQTVNPKPLTNPEPIVINQNPKEPVKPQNPPVKTKPFHIKIALTGENQDAVYALNNELGLMFQKQGMIISGTGSDATLTGTVIISNKKEIPLQPYASSAQTIIQMNLSVKNMKLVSDTGKQHLIGSCSVHVEDTKDREAVGLANAVKSCAEQVEIKRKLKDMKTFLADISNK